MFSPNPTFELCPRDILLNVFDLVLPPVELFKRRHTALTMLRLVCYHWNDVAIVTPGLWSSIYVHIPSQLIPLAVVRTWLARSADADLDISLKDSPPITWTPAEINVRTEILRAIQSHVSHCRSLQLEVSIGFLPGFQSLSLSEGLRLQQFSVNMKGNTDDDVHQNMLRHLASLPHIRNISWSSNYRFFMKSLSHYSSLSWFSRLSSIEATCPISAHEMLELIKQCTSATRITMDYVRCDDTLVSPTVPLFPPTTLPNLRVLDLSLHSSVYQTLLQHFSFPYLDVLRISGPSMSDLSSTIHLLAPSLKFLKTKVWIHGHTRDEICAFLHNILRLPILELQSREYETWGEYGGWDVSNNRPFWEAIETFKQTCVGSRDVKYGQSSDLCEGCFIGWVDFGIYNSYVRDSSKDRGVFALQPQLLKDVQA